MYDPDDIGDLPRDAGRRLALTRQALGLNQQDFGLRAGLSQPQYHQYEKGRRCLTLAAAMRLCSEYHLTLDWLFRGDPSGLPYRLAEAIRDLRRRP
jgi:transcriptional regulator with XRE-family HTH domain